MSDTYQMSILACFNVNIIQKVNISKFNVLSLELASSINV